MSTVRTNIKRVPLEIMAALRLFGVASIHEAQGRRGLLASYRRPIYRPAHIAGTAITCEVAPGDNWMIHVSMNGIELQDREFIAAVRERREPNASVQQALPCYRILNELDRALSQAQR
jgi:regulator of RNase E activity RraA